MDIFSPKKVKPWVIFVVIARGGSKIPEDGVQM